MVAEGIPEEHARHFSSELHEGSVLVTVHTDFARTTEVTRILKDHGADLGQSVRPMPSRTEPGPVAVPPRTGLEPRVGEPRVGEPRAADTPDERHIQLLGERLRVTKEKLGRGDVTVRKEVVTEPQHIEVPVTREEVVVERHPAAGAVPEGEVGKDREPIRLPTTEERVKVEKQPEVREEVTVKSKPVEETKDVTATTRREELRVENKEHPESEKDLPPEQRKKIA